jgi:hypothetical protein
MEGMLMHRIAVALVVAVVVLGGGAAVASTPPDDGQPSEAEQAFTTWAAANGVVVQRLACEVETQATVALCYGLVDGAPVAYESSRNDVSSLWTDFAPVTAAVAPTTIAAAPTTSVTVATTVAAAPTTAGAGGDNAHVFTVGEVVVPAGDAGTVSVVLTGPDDGSSVPMIVRNNTADTLYNLEVTGIARDAAGTLAATGSSQGFEPVAVGPGEWAMGYVYFEALTGGETYEWQTQFDTEAGFIGQLDLTISEAELTSGEFNQQVVGIATNENADPVSSGSVFVSCFDGANLLGVTQGYTDGDEIAAGGFGPFTVDLYDVETCPAMAIAASGYNL